MTTTGPATTTPSGVSPSLDRGLLVVGGGLLLATGGIHLDLYLTGYKEIPTIGWLFLLQVITAMALGLAALGAGLAGDRALRPVAAGLSVREVVAAAGAGFSLATLAGYLISLDHGLFNFKEIRTTAGVVAGIIEIVAFLALGWVALEPVRRQIVRVAIIAPLTVVAVVLLVAGEAGAVTAGSSPGGTTPLGGKEVTIVIKDFAFHPDDPVVLPGEKIVVENEDSVAHTFTTRSGAPVAFNTGPIVPGQDKVITAPTKPGNYPYQCTIHPFMTGVLRIT